MLLGLTLEKLHLGAQLGPFHIHSNTAEEAINYGSLIAQNRVLRAHQKQHVTLVCTIDPPNEPKTNIPSALLQTTMEKDPISSQAVYPQGNIGRIQILLR